MDDHLKSLLLEPPAQHSSSLARPLIQVVRSEGDDVAKDNGEVSFDSKSLDEDYGPDDDDDDDDGGPPPIFRATSPARPVIATSAEIFSAPSGQQTRTDSSICVSQNHSEPSLAELLLAEATLAKVKLQRQQQQKEQQRAKKSTFGMKKGFLNSSSSAKKCSSKKKVGGDQSISKLVPEKNRGDAAVTEHNVDDQPISNDTQNDLIYELDNDGNMVQSPCSRQSPSSNINNPLHLPEVQSAMLSHLQSNSAQWATPDLLDTITKSHPKLARGMQDPRYTAALQNMQTRPKETMESLKKSSPEIVEWLLEFCGVMGEHFLRMGEERDGKKGGSSGEGKGYGVKVREMGPLEKKALERQQQMQSAKDEGSAPAYQDAANPSNAMNSRVSSILANEELRSILIDPVMQSIMEECSAGNKLRYYMGHEEFGPKLRRLMEVGLIKVG